jgi:hypothetical protein
LPLAIPVFVRGLDPHGKQFVDFATALDISVGGALLAIHRALPEGSKIMLEIPTAPTHQNNHSNPKVPRAIRQNFYAKAVRVTNNDTCHLLGLKFQKPLKTTASIHPSGTKAKRKSSSSV